MVVRKLAMKLAMGLIELGNLVRGGEQRRMRRRKKIRKEGRKAGRKGRWTNGRKTGWKD